jgi:transposase-like protein
VWTLNRCYCHPLFSFRETAALGSPLSSVHNASCYPTINKLATLPLSERQDQAAAEAFFRSARTVTGSVPDRVTTDGHGSYPGAIKAELEEAVPHRTNRYLNNHLEQDHRGIKQRTHPM